MARRALLSLLAGSAAVPEGAQLRLQQPMAQVLTRDDADIATKAEIFRHTVGQEAFDWSADLDKGVVRFTTST